MSIFDIITLLGGLAFFLFGMSTMGNGLKSLAGNRMEEILWRLSSNPVKGLLLGTLVTAVIQSSSATSVMVVSFVNAGMMKLSQSITVILGSQIGTTMTGWVLTLAGANGSSGFARVISASTFVPFLGFVGAVMYMFCKRQVWKSTGTILLGFSILMTGMSTMSGSVNALKTDPKFVGLLTLFDNPFLAMLAGIVLAAVIQSCSAGVGILQALSVTGVLSYSVCVPLIMGINIGACAPVLLSMMGSSKNGKRAAISYMVGCVLSVVIVSLVFFPLRALGLFVFMDGTADSVGIALINTVMRIAAVIVLTPLHKQIERICYLLVKYNPDEDADSEFLEKLSDSALRYPRTAVNLSTAAVHKMAEIARDAVTDAIGLIGNYDKIVAERVTNRETLLDKYEDKLGGFMMQLLANEAVPELELEAEKILSSLSDLERLGDHAMNIAELAAEYHEKKLVFSEEAQAELTTLAQALAEIMEITMAAFCENDSDRALQVEPLEEVVDIMCDELKIRHVTRLQGGKCTISLGFVFNDLINNYERVSDHCSNLAFATLKAANPGYTPHEYTSNAEASVVFTDAFLKFTEKYVSNL